MAGSGVHGANVSAQRWVRWAAARRDLERTAAQLHRAVHLALLLVAVAPRPSGPRRRTTRDRRRWRRRPEGPARARRQGRPVRRRRSRSRRSTARTAPRRSSPPTEPRPGRAGGRDGSGTSAAVTWRLGMAGAGDDRPVEARPSGRHQPPADPPGERDVGGPERERPLLGAGAAWRSSSPRREVTGGSRSTARPPVVRRRCRPPWPTPSGRAVRGCPVGTVQSHLVRPDAGLLGERPEEREVHVGAAADLLVAGHRRDRPVVRATGARRTAATIASSSSESHRAQLARGPSVVKSPKPHQVVEVVLRRRVATYRSR